MKQELLLELKNAMKEKDILKKNTITLLRSAILQVEKDNLKELNEDEMKLIVVKEVKKRKDSINEFKKLEKTDIINDLQREIDILSKYLPKQLTEDEVKEIIKNAIIKVNATSPRDMGKVMQEIRPTTQGKFDGKLLSEYVKSMLN